MGIYDSGQNENKNSDFTEKYKNNAEVLSSQFRRSVKMTVETRLEKCQLVSVYVH